MRSFLLNTGLCVTLLSLASRGDAQIQSRRARWKFDATATGYIYASRYFRTRYKPNMNPNICFNMFDTPPELNDTYPNGSRIYSLKRKTYQNFLCPLNEPSKSWCCGPSYRQRCCSYWADYGRSVGASFGIVFAFLLIFWFFQGLWKGFESRCPSLKRCTSICPIRANEIRQSPTAGSSPPEPSSSDAVATVAVVEPKPLTVTPLAPPSYSSLSIRQVDLFGDSLTSNLPPPPNYDIAVQQHTQNSSGAQP